LFQPPNQFSLCGPKLNEIDVSVKKPHTILQRDAGKGKAIKLNQIALPKPEPGPEPERIAASPVIVHETEALRALRIEHDKNIARHEISVDEAEIMQFSHFPCQARHGLALSPQGGIAQPISQTVV
jgi:hypothetical protein